MSAFPLSRAFAESLDRAAPLTQFRDEFPMASQCLYLDGNSLGLLSRRAEASLLAILDSWRTYGIDGWSTGSYRWFDLSEHLGHMMAPLVGAQPHEVIVTGSTTVNLHQLLATFYRPHGERRKILADALAFPSDIYAISSHLLLHGLSPDEALVQVPSHDGFTLSEDDIIDAMTPDVALVLLPSVLFVSGQLLDIPKLTEAAHERHIIIGFDLAHSVGVLPHALSQWGVDFAFWCTYKYLNGGPGSVAALYVAERYHGIRPGLAGWFSSDKTVQFDMAHQLIPAPDAGAFQIGTPHLLSLAPLIGSLEMYSETTIDIIRAKSVQLTHYLMELATARLKDFNVLVVTPQEETQRGGHVALAHPEAVRICKALKDRQVIPDYRPPEVIRLAPSPLYTTYTDIWDTVVHLWHIMHEREYMRYPQEREVIS